YDAVNVLSVPRLMCTDNKESSFQVGQVIPVLKGSASDLTNLGAVQQNYDYKDTGLTLTVTPHIRSGNLVVLDIKQTTEDLLSSTTSTTPITAKRQVNTSVIVADGETIILGGIVKETERSLRRRVPGLSYIPLIGNLFQKVSKEKEKVDFVIFLTPEIIEDPREMRRVTMAATGFAEAAGYPADYPATRTSTPVKGTPDGTANYPANRIAEYQEPTALASGDMNFNTQNLFPKGSRQHISDIEISPVESDIDRRFRELYKKSVKKQ
ncbi:MAG: type II and III secretion system protein, partial [Synergistaceae bacterium]|nr:type II and III secretion system protein [Synergistaceae bacterium]